MNNSPLQGFVPVDPWVMSGDHSGHDQLWVIDPWVTSGDYSGHDQLWVIDDGLQTHG